VNDEERSKLDGLADLIVDAVDAVDLALEEKTRDRVAAAHARLSAAVSTYQELVASTSGGERAQIEQRFERRITDLKRQAARMPQGAMGRAAELARDAGSVPFLEQRAPGKSIQEIAGAPRRGEKPRYSTGGEVEAWCGPCGGLRTHNIYALVNGEPRQVICQSCGAKHGFRTTPARKNEALPSAAPRSGGGYRGAGPSNADREAERKQKELAALRSELQAATNVRPFSPKERYKAGEIIEHPEHGRGKIETVTRGSLLVRFARGLRPLDLQ
jgi:hypothetical protein